MEPLASGDALDRADPGRDVVRGGMWTAAGALVGTPLSAVTNVVVARALGAEQVGRYGVVVSAFLLAATLLNVGVSSASVQWLAKSRGRGDRATFDAVVRFSSLYHLLVQGPLLAAVVLFLIHDAPLWIVVSGVTGTFVEQALGTSSIVLSATARNSRAAQISLVGSLATSAALVAVALTLPSAVALLGVLRLVAVLASALGFLSLDRSTRALLRRPALLKPLPPGFRAYSINVAVLAIAGLLVFGRSELLVLSADGREQAAGLFVVAAGLAGLITVPMDSLMAPLAPAAAFYSGVSAARARAVLLRSLRVTSVLGGATAATAPAVVALLLPTVYGQAFDSAVLAAQVLTGVSLVQSVVGPLSVFALAGERTRELLVISVLAAMIDAGVALAAIPVFGLAGAVAASSVAQLAHLIGAAEVAARATESSRVAILAQALPALLGLATGAVSVVVGRQLALGPLGYGSLTVAAFVVFRFVLHAAPGLRIPGADWDRLLAGLGSRARPVVTAARAVLGSA